MVPSIDLFLANIPLGMGGQKAFAVAVAIAYAITVAGSEVPLGELLVEVGLVFLPYLVVVVHQVRVLCLLNELVLDIR